MTAKRMGLVGLCAAAALAASLVIFAPAVRTCFFKPGADAPPPVAPAEKPQPQETQIIQTLEEYRAIKMAERPSLLRKLERMDDQALLSAANDRIDEDAWYTEIIRRGGPKWTAYLEDKIRKTMEEPPREYELRPHGAYPLKLLTVLRRLQGSKDPLAVFVDKPPPIYVMPDMPGFCVRLVNTDAKGLPIYIPLGGDYRSGRRTKFSMEVTDSNGRELPILPDWSDIRGGILDPTVIKSGEAVVGDSGMYLASYVTIPKPGKYTIRVLFSEHIPYIADMDHTEGVIAYRSDPFVIDFQAPPTRRSREADETVRSLLAQLPEEGPIIIFDGHYSPLAHDMLIPPDTPVGRILTLGWQAVPVMVDELGSPAITPGRRAWLEGLLFSVTACNDPRDRCPLFPRGHGELMCRFWWTDIREISPMFERGMLSYIELKAIAARWAEWKPLLNAAPAPSLSGEYLQLF